VYKSKEKQKEANRLANQKYREKQKGITEGITENGEGITPAIIKALVDPQKRVMLEYISEDLNRKHLGDLLRYGVFGPDFTVIAELLEVTA